MEVIGSHIGEERSGLGRMKFETTHNPTTFIVRASGMDGPILSKKALIEAEAFALNHPSGWVWISDLRSLLWSSPRSLRHVRKVRQLPNIKGYAVIARQPLLALERMVCPFSGAQPFKTLDDALAFAAEKL